LIDLDIVGNIDFAGEMERLKKCIDMLGVQEKLKQRLIYRLEDVKVACAYRKQLKQMKLRGDVYRQKLAGIEKELRRLGNLN